MPMTARGVLGILDLLAIHGVDAWIGGGWGVDALVGRATRDHADLDLAIPTLHFEACRSALLDAGFETTEDWLPVRLEMAHPDGRRVDLHPIRFRPDGSAVKKGLNGTTFEYPPDGFAEGRIEDQRVTCIGAHLQMAFHEGYAWSDKDRHDIRLLAGLLGIDPAVADR